MKNIIKFFKWLIKSVLFGMLIIFVYNILGSYLNLNIPVNIYTIMTIGMLRIPGLAAIIILSMI